MASGIKGDWTVSKRADGTGGNLEVAAAARFMGSVSIEGTLELPGLIIDHHQHDAGDIVTGTINPARLPIATSSTPGAVLPGNGLDAGETLTVKAKEGGALGVDSGGVYLDGTAAASLIGLGTAAYKTAAGNTGTSADAGKVPILGADGKLANEVIPRYAINETYTVNSDAAMIELNAHKGDVCIRPDIGETFILSANDPAVLANWVPFATPSDAVRSVNGKTGAVALAVSDIYATAETKCGGVAVTVTSAAEDYTLATRKAVYDFARNADNLAAGKVAAARLTFATHGTTPAGSTETVVCPAYVTAAISALNIETYATSEDLTEAKGEVLGTVAETYATKDQLNGYSVTSHQHTVQPVDPVPASGVITLAKNKTHYRKAITGNTTLGFDATALGLTADEAATFELVLTTGTNTYPVLFGPSISWLNGEEPYFNTPNTSYLCAFRTYNGGASWVGAYQGQF